MDLSVMHLDACLVDQRPEQHTKDRRGANTRTQSLSGHTHYGAPTQTREHTVERPWTVHRTEANPRVLG
eukprot:519569-Prymnesium_polylepis.1